MVLGTAGYMSPEQVKGEPVDARSDIFAFGLILYEMLSGRRAFKRDSGIETMYAIVNEEPPELSNVPTFLDRIVRRCIEKKPSARFQSARDVTYALDMFEEAAEHPRRQDAIGGPRRSTSVGPDGRRRRGPGGAIAVGIPRCNLLFFRWKVSRLQRSGLWNWIRFMAAAAHRREEAPSSAAKPIE
jgi:serine/threonine protein kinase